MLPPNAWLRWDAVSQRLPPEGASVLEIGCGQGGFAARLAARYRYVGLEPDVDSFEVARGRLEGAGEIRNGDLSLVGRDEQFDLVCAFEVIEHMEDDRGAIEAWLRHVRPGGWLLVSAPAWPQRFSTWDELVGHYRRYEPAGISRLLVELGLEDVEAAAFGAPLGYVLEGIRNRIAGRRLPRARELSFDERTSGSGRLLEPRGGAVAAATHATTFPFMKLQRLFPGRGVGLVARGRRPLAA